MPPGHGIVPRHRVNSDVRSAAACLFRGCLECTGVGHWILTVEEASAYELGGPWGEPRDLFWDRLGPSVTNR